MFFLRFSADCRMACRELRQRLPEKVRVLNVAPTFTVNGGGGKRVHHLRFDIRPALFREDEIHLNHRGSTLLQGMVRRALEEPRRRRFTVPKNIVFDGHYCDLY